MLLRAVSIVALPVCAVCRSTHLLLLLVQAALERVRNHIPDTELENAKVLLLLLPREFVLSDCMAVDSFPVFHERVDNPQYRTYIRCALACVSSCVSSFFIYRRHLSAPFGSIGLNFSLCLRAV